MNEVKNLTVNSNVSRLLYSYLIVMDLMQDHVTRLKIETTV